MYRSEVRVPDTLRLGKKFPPDLPDSVADRRFRQLRVECNVGQAHCESMVRPAARTGPATQSAANASLHQFRWSFLYLANPICRMREPAPRHVISHRQGKHDCEPEESRAYKHGNQSALVFDLHEEQDNENRLRKSDRHSRYHVQRTQRKIGEADGGAKKNEQRGPDGDVGTGRNDMFAHTPVLFTR